MEWIEAFTVISMSFCNLWLIAKCENSTLHKIDIWPIKPNSDWSYLVREKDAAKRNWRVEGISLVIRKVASKCSNIVRDEETKVGADGWFASEYAKYKISFIWHSILFANEGYEMRITMNYWNRTMQPMTLINEAFCYKANAIIVDDMKMFLRPKFRTETHYKR